MHLIIYLVITKHGVYEDIIVNWVGLPHKASLGAGADLIFPKMDNASAITNPRANQSRAYRSLCGCGWNISNARTLTSTCDVNGKFGNLYFSREMVINSQDLNDFQSHFYGNSPSSSLFTASVSPW